MYQEVNTSHLIFREAQYPDEIQELNQVYAKLPFIPHFIYSDLERIKFSVRGHLLQTTDAYVWKHGLIGNVQGNFGEELGILILFPQKILVNLIPTMERSIAIFGQHPFDFGYRKFLLDFIGKLKIFSLKLELYQAMANSTFSDKPQLPSQDHFCEICRETTAEKEFYFSPFGAVHKSCAAIMDGSSSIF